jgi:hypothetical protein
MNSSTTTPAASGNASPIAAVPAATSTSSISSVA